MSDDFFTDPAYSWLEGNVFHHDDDDFSRTSGVGSGFGTHCGPWPNWADDDDDWHRFVDREEDHDSPAGTHAGPGFAAPLYIPALDAAAGKAAAAGVAIAAVFAQLFFIF